MRFAAVVLLLCSGIFAQVQTVPPESPDAQRTRIESMEKRLSDWPNLARYAEANAALPPPTHKQRRVVFMGDSITQGWDLVDSFPGRSYVNRGISGQTTPQMLIRFHPDVVNLKPSAVVILGGTNDLAGRTGPMTIEQIEENLASMADIARANRIRVVLASLMPVYASAKRPELIRDRPPKKILTLNQWIRSFCERTRCVYLDYFSAMVGADGLMKRDLSDYGLHPNSAGYKVIAPLAEAAIAKALAHKQKK